MATNIRDDGSGPMQRLFLEHPRSLGMSWAEHGVGAVKIAGELIGAGCAALVHAAVPGWFTETARKNGDAHLRPYSEPQGRRGKPGELARL